MTSVKEEDYNSTVGSTFSSKSNHIHHRASNGNFSTGTQEVSDDDDTPIDPQTLDWDGPADMDNPHNWSTLKKWSCTMIAAILCLVVTMGSSLYVTGVPEMVLQYHYSQTLALAGLTFYLFGLSTTMGAPLSEVFGRKPVYVISLPLSMLFAMGVALSGGKQRIILPLRFFSGVFASPALSVAGGTIMDVFDIDEVSVSMTFFCLAPFLGPVISPVMASFATEKKGWRWATYIQLIAGGVIMPFLILMPETHKGVILRKRAKKRGLNLKKLSKEDQKIFAKMTLKITLTRPLHMLVVEPIVLVFSIYVAFIFAVLFAFFEAYPVIYRGVYHMSIGISGLPFLGIGIGLWLGSAFYLFIDRKYLFPAPPKGTPPLANSTSLRTTPYRGKRNAETGELVPILPEDLLLACKFGAVALPVALFWQAWTARADVHWMAPIAAGVPFGFGLILIFFSVIMYFSTCYPPIYMASAMAANNMLRYVTSSVFPLFTIQMYQNMKIQWASTLFALICCVLLPVAWIFEKWGPRLRTTSEFGWAAFMKQQAEEKAKLEAEKNENHLTSNTDIDQTTIEENKDIEDDVHDIKTSGGIDISTLQSLTREITRHSMKQEHEMLERAHTNVSGPAPAEIYTNMENDSESSSNIIPTV
ncbi:hypothetical protein TBLA_0D01160 [Henningerozyma blattae CBS 6284]|uniref:Major facilitator superfamily (MFS) profile domain-containing protein n=1 Tax=Henningerozyma blattae (strain ATCC 34711 / CBS 6284 / DSM 70876 / NBRC 10599 / NRRL Y-10934 / UCD 77-7) TaxID=1071380 RepID=I2H2M2_HENB6|nr:hypothetical protein TBLA_0D01160 [Tetrapisispora blattae CBS 6284]CCH60624.1 hypothetical protein TBLA_0D01160 [Tetrapisispora blattae CBS 6284]